MNTGLASPALSDSGVETTVDNAFKVSSIPKTPICSTHSTNDTSSSPPRHERKLGNSELAFYLPARANGVNDMYKAMGVRALERIMRRSRVRVAWAILRMRNPLLASTVNMHGYDDVRFVHAPPGSVDDALMDAHNNLEYSTRSQKELIDKYINGPRTLSDSRLSYLIISQPGKSDISLPTPPMSPALGKTATLSDPPAEEMYDYEIVICAAHFIGDGMSIYDLSAALFDLLGNDKTTTELEGVLHDEWHARYGSVVSPSSPLPSCQEDRLIVSRNKFRRIAAKVDFHQNQQKQIGGQVFPRRHGKPMHTTVSAASFDEEKTRAMLKKCKAQGVSLSIVVFALCNFAWARVTSDRKDMPMMIYSALNTRPYLKSNPLESSNQFLAVGYFNIVLPSFIPKASDEHKLFWHRARSAKEQCARTAKNPMVVSRIYEMAEKRAFQARAWAAEDDRALSLPTSKPAPVSNQPSGAPGRPSSATLLGVSLLGNFNGLLEHAKFPYFELKTLAPGTRQRPGGMLMFSYSFANKLWISMSWDENGYEKEVVEKFWDGVLGGVDEFLVG